MNVDKWKLSVNDIDDLKKLAKKHGGVQEDNIVIEGIYITNVAIAVYVRIINLVAHNSADEVKEALGRFLRFISSCAEQFGYILPLLAVIEGEEGHEAIIQKWAADQDWHRGDFSLFFTNKNHEIGGESGELSTKDTIQELIAAPDDAYTLEKINPVNVDLIKIRLDSEMKSRKGELSDEYYRLLEAIYDALGKDNKALTGAITNWVDKELEEIIGSLRGNAL